MKKWIVLFSVAALAVAGCSKKKGDEEVNPIDVVMEPLFAGAGLEMIDAQTPELCRRLYADLLGRFPTADEVAKDCDGRSVTSIVRDFQRRPEYLLHAQSNWRDILGTNDVSGDWRYLKEIYEMVDQVHLGELEYGEFATRVLMHPGFINQDVSSIDRTARAFRAFMGRPATNAEVNDISALFRVWGPPGFVAPPDPDFPYTYRIAGGIAPVLCEPLSNCTAELLGGGTMDFGPQTTFEVIAYEDLTPDQLDILREPGRLFTRQAFFWEAAADEILNRTLSWSDGGRFPRTPGIVLPEVRQIVADILRDSGNYALAERTVYTSILYRGAAEIEPDGYGDDPLAPEPPIWSNGPVKYTRTEVVFNTLQGVSVDFGTCDPRYTDLFSGYFQIFTAYQDGIITLEQTRTDIARLAELQEIRMELTDYDGTEPIPQPDATYTFIARLVGGCPGFQNERYDGRAGLAYSFTQETLAELLCQFPEQLQGSDTSVGGILTHQMRQLFSRNPTSAEITSFEDAFATCAIGTEDCSTTGLANGVCVALAGSNEILFY